MPSWLAVLAAIAGVLGAGAGAAAHGDRTPPLNEQSPVVRPGFFECLH